MTDEKKLLQTNEMQETKEKESADAETNDECKKYTAEEIKILEEKSRKYDLIKDDYEAFKNAAEQNGQTVVEFLNSVLKEREEKRLNELIEQTGGNEELSRKILSFEKEKKGNENDFGFSELKEMFPEKKEIGELPVEVTENAQIKGTKLLDEYLRYLLKEHRLKEEAKKNSLKAKNASTGALNNESGNSDTSNEFIRGIWNR